ncbi:thioredoxin family protein [Ruminococcaceae bacterium OttesenSCG-928-I18]|nr:thioredoxin family protein [Ruminococcaceae bacterium OttesenSCG-928-I18]
MMGKELLFKVMRHEKTEEIPWVPFAGVHAGYLKGYTAKEVLTDGDKLFESLLEVHKLYRPDGMPIVFDLQVEAEIMGCELFWAEDNPPSVMSHPYEGEDLVDIESLSIPKKTEGRIPLILDVMERMKKAVGHDTALYGLVCGPLTLASHLRGSELFTDIFEEPEFAEEMFAFCSDVCIAMADYYMQAGMDVIAVVDPLVSQVSPRHFENLISAGYVRIFDHLRDAGVISSFFVCGNATVQLEVMCHTKPDNISVDENVDLISAKEITDRYNITLGGNIPLTTTMLFGNQKDNMKYVVELLDNIGHDNLIISPGCDMPYNIPPENTIAVVEAVKHTEVARTMVAGYEADSGDIDVELPDYGALEKPMIEVFTLDAATCAACTYMLAAAMQAKDEYKDAVDVLEYKYTVKEDVARTKKMGVQKLPSIYINGELKWSSIIPSKQELFDEIEPLL